MKKLLLSIPALMIYASTVLAQNSFIQAADNSGFTYNCDLGIAQSEFSWSLWGPACAGSDNGGGGFDESLVNEFAIKWGQGGKGQMWVILTLTQPLNLSNSTNQKLKFNLQSLNPTTSNADPITYNLRLEDANNTSLISPIPLAVTGTASTFDIDLSSNVLSGQNLSAVKKIILVFDGCAANEIHATSELLVTEFKVGSYLVNGIEDDLLKNISSSSVYPNPTSNSTTVSLNLNKASDVKIILSNALGSTIKEIANETTNFVSKTIDTSSLTTGLYFVNYFLNGVAVKTEKLIVN